MAMTLNQVFTNVLSRLKKIAFAKEDEDVAVCPAIPLYEKFLLEETDWVQVSNENFFEEFTVLSWRRENHRLQIIRKEESEKHLPPPTEPGQAEGKKYRIEQKQWENLYVEVLYTIRHKLGVNSSNYAEYTGELYEYARRTFAMTADDHVNFMAIAEDEKPPMAVLNVTVVEATGLEAKDPNGTSDPYCMLGIQPDPDAECKREASLRGLKKFGASLKRRSNSEALPAKLIRTTTVKSETLNPKWREKFRLDVDDVRTDRFHLDIWDHDDETSVIDAARRLNEVSNLKGLGRYFKEVAQSARASNGENVDDFLGSINLPLDIVSSNGLDRWFTLLGRSHRSTVHGRVRLKLQLGTREDRAVPSGNDNEREVSEHQQLIWVFVSHELNIFTGKAYEWAGDLPQQALTILHQHAIQGDITEFQQAVCQWTAYFRKHQEVVFDYSLMYQQLEEIAAAWEKNEEAPSAELMGTLADTFNEFIEHCFLLIRHHRRHFPSHNVLARHKLKFILKCLSYMYSMEAFKECFPFRNELRVELSNVLKKGTVDWMNEVRSQLVRNESLASFIQYVDVLNIDLHRGINHYHLLFDSTVQVNFCPIVYKQMMRQLLEEVYNKVGRNRVLQQFMTQQQNREHMNRYLSQLEATQVFEFYLVFVEFSTFKTCLPEEEQQSLSMGNCYLWFEDVITGWFRETQSKVRVRVYFGLEHDRDLYNQPPGVALDLTDDGPRGRLPKEPLFRIKYSSSAVDTMHAVYQLKEFWFQLNWPDKYSSYPFVRSIIEATADGVVLYSNLTWKRLRDDVSCFNAKGHFVITRKVILYMNNLEYVLSSLQHLETDLDVEAIIATVAEKGNAETAKECYSHIKTPILKAREHITGMIECFIRSIAHHMECRIRKLLFHLAWGPEKMEAERCIAPLLEYLQRIFFQVRMNFLQTTFHRLVRAIWIQVLAEFTSTSTKNLKEKPRFYRNLYTSLNILTEFFLGDSVLLPLEDLQCQSYMSVEREVRIHQSDTFPLIEYYYFSRAEEQFNSRDAPLGYLTVTSYFDGLRNTVYTEVINARDLLPCDPNGLSDPFVILQLVPKHLFPNVTTFKSSIRMKTLNPIFREKFEWQILPELRHSKGVAINFVVMDFDFMRKNDFEGEAYYPLCKMIDIAEGSTVPEPEELILTCPSLNCDILAALSKRSWNKDATKMLQAERKKT